MTAERRWISPLECSEFLGIHKLSVYKMIADGRIPAARLGRLVRVDLRALEADLERQVQGTPGAGRVKGRRG